MKTSDQTGSSGAYTQVVLYIVLCLLLAVIVYLQMHVEEPLLTMVNFKYKSNYYQKFILPEGYDRETQGRKWANWHQDEAGIQTMCNLFNNSAGYINDNLRKKHGKLGLKVWEEWIVAFLNELEKTDIVNPGFQGFPWGANWYQFTISVTTCMAYYIVNKGNSRAVNRYASKAIQYIIVDPQHSLGYERDKANSAMMVFPWTLAHLITGTLDTENEGYKYAIKQYDLAPNETIRVNEDGVHIDYAYLIHNGVYAYGYFESIYAIYPDTKQVIPAVAKLNIDHHHDMWTSKLYHPKIQLSGSTLFHRRNELGCASYHGKLKTSSVVTVPSMKYLRIFGNDFQWSVRLGGISIVYYECDQKVYNMGLYSCLCKERFTSSSSKEARFPVSGFVYPKGATELTEVDPNPGNISHPTTYGYYSSSYTNHAHSFVMVDYDEGIAFFKVLHIRYVPLIDTHIDESGYFDFKTKTLRYWLYLDGIDNYVFYWGGEELDFSKIDLDGKQVVEATMNMQTGATSYGPSHVADTYTAELYELNKKYVTTSNQDGHYPTASSDAKDSFTIVWKDSKPFIYIPGETEIHNRNKTVTYKGETMNFVFDEEWNQYLSVDYVKLNTYLYWDIDTD